MESCLVLDAHSYHKFSNYHEMELEYMRFITEGNEKASKLDQTNDSFLVKEIQKVRDNIKSSLESNDSWSNRMEKLESLVREMFSRVNELEIQIQRLNKILPSDLPKYAKPVLRPVPAASAPPLPAEDDVDLFNFAGDAVGGRQSAATLNKKAGASRKEKPIAKSIIVLDVKPWDDTTDMKAMEERVRAIATDGLLWGTSKLVPLVHGISKLQIACVVEDDKVGTDFLEEHIMELEDYVQSVDVASFNKL